MSVTDDKPITCTIHSPAPTAPSPTSPARGFSTWNPWAKLGMWCGIVLGVGLVLQCGAWLVGLDFDITARSGGGRAALMLVAVGSLLALMAADRRPASDYGLIVGQQWLKQLLSATAIGAGAYLLFGLTTVLVGTQEFSFKEATPYRWLSGFMAGMTSFPLAMSQQVIFSGYLLSLFRTRHSRATSVGLVSLLFAATFLINEPIAISAEDVRLFAGMFVISCLLCLLRLSYGTIIVPAGALAGAMLVRRVIRRTGLWVVCDPHASNWWAPTGDPRQSPVLWLALGVLAAVYAWRLRTRGEAQHAGQTTIDSSFKRVAPFSNACMLAPLDLWISRLWQAKFDIGPQYFPRLAAITALSTLNTILSLPERLLTPWLVGGRKLQDPVFILGVHRSGTTHLHNLLALDPQLVTPRAYQIMNPIGFMFSGWLLAPLLGAFSPWKRPMDSVRFHLFAPNEDEFALTGVTSLSPYWGLTFPRQWPHYDRFIFPEQMTSGELASWRRHYRTFLKKLVYWSGKRALLKNPYNTARVQLLHSMFPGARFIHIHRHPDAVYRSNLHMAREGHCVYQLHDPQEATSYGTRFLESYRAMEEAYYREGSRLPAHQNTELRFEDLERDAIGEVRRIYRELKLEFTPPFEARLVAYLADVADYEKNRFRPMPRDEQLKIYRGLAPLFARWGYAPPESANETARAA